MGLRSRDGRQSYSRHLESKELSSAAKSTIFLFSRVTTWQWLTKLIQCLSCCFAFSKMLCRHLTSYLYCYTFFDSGTGFAARKRLNYARNRFPKMKKSCIVVFICLSNHLEWISAKSLRNQLTI